MLARSPFIFDEKISLQMLARNAERQGPLDCEITEGARANWYLVQTFPNETARAMRWLAKRMFGAFRPMQQQVDRRSGKKLAGWEDVFPGWIFIFAWDIGRMKARILRCPGCYRIFSDPTSKEPVAISDGFVQRIRALSFEHDGSTNRRDIKVATFTQKQKVRRLDKRQRKTLHKLKELAKSQHRIDQSTWDKLNQLEPYKRIALLQRALTSAIPLQVISSSGCAD